MISTATPFEKAMAEFDAYNAKDPNIIYIQDRQWPKELLYAKRMSEQLEAFSPTAPEHIQLAARSQHIGRWEIPRSEYSMDRKGYLLWRAMLKKHHAAIVEDILNRCGYPKELIEKVAFLLLKKQLQTNPETQLLEDVVCLVFVQYYLQEFSTQHKEEKVIDIIRKTLKKMSPKAISKALEQAPSERIKKMLLKAAE